MSHVTQQSKETCQRTYRGSRPSIPVDVFFGQPITQTLLKCISKWLEDFTKYSSFSDICKDHGDVKFLGANVFVGIVLQK